MAQMLRFQSQSTFSFYLLSLLSSYHTTCHMDATVDLTSKTFIICHQYSELLRCIISFNMQNSPKEVSLIITPILQVGNRGGERLSVMNRNEFPFSFYHHLLQSGFLWPSTSLATF